MRIVKNASGSTKNVVIVCYNKDTNGVDAVYGPYKTSADMKKNKAKITKKLIEELEAGDEEGLKELYDIWVLPLSELKI